MFGKKKYEITEGEYGPRLSPMSPWSDKMERIIKQKGIVELELNRAKRWEGNDLSFLENIKELQSLEINDWKNVDLSPIHCLNKLRRLAIDTYCKNEINYTCFPELKSASLEWRPKAKSIFQCLTLEYIFINNYPGEDLEGFSKHINLHTLRLKSPKIKRIGKIHSLVRLTFLELSNARRLESLIGVEVLKNLEYLKIESSRKIQDIDSVKSLLQLKRLLICDCGEIKSLVPLLNLQGLKEFIFHESTDILDGDLSPLKKLPNIEKVSFQERPHYNYQRKDIPGAE